MNTSLKSVFEVYVCVYAFLFASRPLSDGDFWWHLKTGEYILKNNSIPRTDIYSFTNFGKPWVAHEWLSEVIFYFIYSRFGFNALIFIFTVLTVLAFWVVFRRSQSHFFIKGLAMLLGVWSILPTVGVRPRTFTLLFAGIYLAVLTPFARGEKVARIWWLVPLMVLWVNLHAGFLIGLVLIGLTIAGVILDAWWAGASLPVSPRLRVPESPGPDLSSLPASPRPLPWPRLKSLGFLLLATLLAVNLNPQGPRIFLFPFEFFLSPVQQDQVIDWLSPNFHQNELLPLAFLILLTIAALALSPKRVRPSELLFFLSTLYATLKSNRHMAIFALIAAPLLADYLQHWLETTSLNKRLSSSPASGSRRGAILFSILLLAPVLPSIFKLKSTIYSPPRQAMVGVPLKAVEYMKTNQVTGNTFTDPNIWSGYLIWEMPSNPVYIDGRIDMYGDEFVRDYIKISYGLTDWRSPFNHHAVRVVVLSPKSVLRLQLQNSPDWERVYTDEMADVFTRRSG